MLAICVEARDYAGNMMQLIKEMNGRLDEAGDEGGGEKRGEDTTLTQNIVRGKVPQIMTLT